VLLCKYTDGLYVKPKHGAQCCVQQDTAECPCDSPPQFHPFNLYITAGITGNNIRGEDFENDTRKYVY